MYGIGVDETEKDDVGGVDIADVLEEVLGIVPPCEDTATLS
jgi:hypothetical protein